MYIIDNKMFTKYLQLLILQHKPRPPPTFTSFHNIKHMNISYLHMYGRDLSRPLAHTAIRERDKGACPLALRTRTWLRLRHAQPPSNTTRMAVRTRFIASLHSRAFATRTRGHALLFRGRRRLRQCHSPTTPLAPLYGRDLSRLRASETLRISCVCECRG